MSPERRLKIRMNSNVKMSRGKYAAQAVHAALTLLGVHPGCAVVVLGAKPDELRGMPAVIHDAGKTELEPGTLTAGAMWEGGTPEMPEEVRFLLDHPVRMPEALFTGMKVCEHCGDKRCPHAHDLQFACENPKKAHVPDLAAKLRASMEAVKAQRERNHYGNVYPEGGCDAGDCWCKRAVSGGSARKEERGM